MNDATELSFCDLDHVAGGYGCLPVPGGSVCKGPGGTTIYSGNVMIEIDNKGGMTTTVTTVPK
jgi:hypothetical protein